MRRSPGIRRRLLALGLVIWTAGTGLGSHPASAEPDKGAVFLSDRVHLVVKDNGRARYRVERAVRIDNSRGDKYAHVTVPESDLINIKDIEGRIETVDGQVLRKLDGDEIHRAKLSPGSTLHSDQAYRWFSLEHSRYPYVVRYAFELELETLYLWQAWTPQRDVPVQQAEYRLSVPADFGFARRSRGLVEPDSTQDGKEAELTWTLRDVPPRRKGRGVPPEDRNGMELRFAPSEFRVEKTRGRLDTWDGLAKFYAELARGRYELGDDAKAAVQRTVDGAASDAEKVARLYTFLQEEMRYVAIQLGVGGWQPSRAKDSYRNRYGDCKDLTTLMVGMLDEVGIPAYPALCLTRDQGAVDPAFPANWFNHVIAYVPLEEGPLWLECTSSRHAAGDLPATTEGCNVLVVREDGGEILRTTESSAAENRAVRRLTGVLSPAGRLEFDLRVELSGNWADPWRASADGMSEEERRAEVASMLGQAPTAKLTRVKFHNLDGSSLEPLRIAAAGAAPQFATKTQDRLILKPSVFTRTRPFEPDSARTSGFYFHYAYTVVDSVLIEVPKGYRLEAGPPPQEAAGDVGSYRMEANYGKRQLSWVRTIVVNERLVPPERLDQLGEVMSVAAEGDRGSFSFKKAERRR